MRVLRGFAIQGNAWAVEMRVTDIDQPGEGFLFELAFGHFGPPIKMSLSATLM